MRAIGGSSRRGASPTMIGREGELRRLGELAAMPGTGVAILAGEPGIGKTRLVRELLAVLPERATVLVGQAEPGSLGRPFELLLSALDGRPDLTAGDVTGTTATGTTATGTTATGSTVTGSTVTGPSVSGPELARTDVNTLADTSRTLVERLRTGLQILLDLTPRGPAVVVFEDLHWADAESIALFERIADLEGDRLLIGTYRPGEVARRDPVAGMLDRLERRHSVYHVHLERLDLEQTSAMLAAATGRPPSYRSAVALHDRTGGNPFFLEELLRAGEDLDELCEQPLPWSLAEALRREVDHLEPSHQRLVEAAGVLGHRVPFDLLASVTGRDEGDLIWALRDLVAQGVLVEIGEDEFAFRHALVREAITDRLLGRERRRLHEAALTALLAAGEVDWALVAKHARGAGRYDDMLTAVRHASADYLTIGSAFQALQLAEVGLAEAGQDPDLLATAGRAAWLAGLLDDADTYARRWHSGARNREESVAALSLRVRLAWEIQDLDLMATLSAELEHAQGRLADGPERARAIATLAQSARLRDLNDEALSWVDRAVRLTDELGGLPEVKLAALAEKGALQASLAASIEEGRALLADVADEAEKAGEWLVAAHCLNRLVHLPPSTSWHALADLLERMRTDAERAGSESLAFAAYYQGRARMFIQKGNLAAATDAIERGRAHELGYRRSRTKSDTHGVFLAGLLLEAGNVGRAAQITADVADVPGMGIALPGLAFHIACRRGDLGQARRLLPDVVSVARSTGGRDGEFLHDLTSAALAAPLPVADIAALVDGLDGPAVEPAYRRLVAGQLAEARSEAEAALGHYRFASAGMLPPAARATAHVGAARSLITGHRLDEARTHALAASELLTRWSGWRVDQLNAVRSRLGLRDTAVGSGGSAALTPREREVAVLLAEGLTNAELASRLYISPRTAAVHVSSILRKLGVTSRTDVGAALSG